ncbi:MAG: immunoglobulin domain-containing protein [Sedimentisphaerales bacterium]|nr:immunoglobulin domain-containing protein [Sedimentisphaerales bacterium]
MKLSTLLISALMSTVLPACFAYASGDVTMPGDPVIGQPNNGNWPNAEPPASIIDDKADTKYLHREAINCGIIVSPQKGTSMPQTSIVQGITITSANDAAERDPWSYELFGSNGYSSEGPWHMISSGEITDFANGFWPRNTINSTPITFTNNEFAYKHYKLLFPTNGGDSMFQAAEIELLGTADTTAFVSTPAPANGARDIALTPTMQWIKPNDPNTVGMYYKVYFGEDPNTLNPSYYGNNLVKTTTTNASDCYYYVTQGLQAGTTYYWRVDGIKGTTVKTGPVWHFNTLNYVPEMLSITSGGTYRDGENLQITASYVSNQANVNGVTWYCNDTAIDPADPAYSVVFTDTNSTLSILNVSSATAGDYYCIARNSYGDSARSPKATVTLRTPWVWVGTGGNWYDSMNWDKATVPALTDDVTIGAGAATYNSASVNDHFFYSGNISLESNGELIVPDGRRFGGGSDANTTLNIADNSKLTVGATHYFLVARSRQSTINQTGGTVTANVSRGFFLNDNELATGIYNLDGGSLNVNYVNTGNVTTEWWSDVLGRYGNGDTLHINGGTANFTAIAGLNRDFLIMRNSTVQIDSGSANLNGFRKLYIGHKYDGNSYIILNGGELNINNPLCIGNSGIGTLAINGGELNINVASDIAISSGAGTGVINQTGGLADFNGGKVVLGGSSRMATYSISGGEIANVSTLTLDNNSEFKIAGSGAGQIDIQEFTVKTDATPVLSVDLDSNGCSVITVGSDLAGGTAGADLSGLTLSINTLESFVADEGATYDILWAANNGINGEETITVVNNTTQLFELRVVDATRYGYASGELLQVVSNYNPANADLSGDGIINLEDLAIFSQFWLWSDSQE